MDTISPITRRRLEIQGFVGLDDQTFDLAPEFRIP